MTQPIIEVKNLSKEYIISHNIQPYYTLRDSLMQIVKKPFTYFSSKNFSSKKEKFWALKDVNFSVMPGEAVGIIGRNGAGKSTLLKILSQITPPTSGSIHLRGRVASLLEVGTGFHPELTGRENIFLNGAILGMTRKEIVKKFDEILAFAEIEKFLDTPVKRYSSGMYVRLAFAIAAHLEPEILIVDEVLAVGDAAFQKKCLGKMNEISKENGRTVLFVSHNMAAVQNLCKKAIFLENGKIKLIGDVLEVIDNYTKFLSVSSQKEQFFKTELEGFDIELIKILKNPKYKDPLNFIIIINSEIIKENVTIELHIINSQSNRIMTGKVVVDKIIRGKNKISLKINNPQLPPGNYELDVSMHTFNTGFFYKQNVLFFEITSEGVDDPFVIARRDTLGVYPETTHVLNIEKSDEL